MESAPRLPSWRRGCVARFGFGFWRCGICVGLLIGRLHRLDGLRCGARYPSSGFRLSGFGSGLNVEDGIRNAASVMAVGLCCVDWFWVLGGAGFVLVCRLGDCIALTDCGAAHAIHPPVVWLSDFWFRLGCGGWNPRRGFRHGGGAVLRGLAFGFLRCGICVGLLIGRLHRLDGLRCCARYPSSGCLVVRFLVPD